MVCESALTAATIEKQVAEPADSLEAGHESTRGLDDEPLFLEVTVDDSSDFETELQVRGVVRHGYRSWKSTALPSRTPSPPSCSISGT
jgi:hypothetical protein